MEKVEILKSIINSDGIIIRWPKKKEEKRAVLEYLITKFEHGKKYALRIRFEGKPGYTFAEDAVYKINNQSTSCYGSSMHREIIYEVIGTEIDVTSGSQLKDALNRNMPVEAINIVSDITVSYNCIHHQARKYGKTKFGLDRFVNGYLDLMTLWFTGKFGAKPMQPPYDGSWKQHC